MRGAPLEPFAKRLKELIRRFGGEVDRALIRHREQILDRQYVQERLARAAMELFASACVLSRWEAELLAPPGSSSEPGWHSAAEYFLRGSFRRTRRSLAEMHETNPRSVWGYVQGLTRLSQSTPWQDARFSLDQAASRLIATVD